MVIAHGHVKSVRKVVLSDQQIGRAPVPATITAPQNLLDKEPGGISNFTTSLWWNLPSAE